MSAQDTVARAFKILDEAGAVLEGASAPEQATALHAWRVAHADALTALTKEIRAIPLDELKPFIMAERDKHTRAGAAIEQARASSDQALVAEIVALSDLFGGPR
jgi:hypothetical protein